METTKTVPSTNLEESLAEALLDEFLRMRGFDWHALRALPTAEAELVLKGASTYVAGRLAEIEARSHFVHEMHHVE